MDCMKVAYYNCQIVCELDDSSSYTKVKEDGLGVNGLNVNWSGKQLTMRNSKMVAGYLEASNLLLKITEIQTINFAENEVPFY